MTEQKQSSAPPMGGGRGIRAAGEKAKDFKGTMLHLLQYLMVYKAQVAIVILFAACSSVFSIIGPKVLGKATTKLFEGMMAWMMGTGLLTDFRYIRNCLLLLVVLYLISAVFSYLQSYIMSGVSMKVTYQFRKDISAKMNRLPLSYYDTRTHGEVLSRITNDVDTVSHPGGRPDHDDIHQHPDDPGGCHGTPPFHGPDHGCCEKIPALFQGPAEKPWNAQRTH